MVRLERKLSPTIHWMRFRAAKQQQTHAGTWFRWSCTPMVLLSSSTKIANTMHFKILEQSHELRRCIRILATFSVVSGASSKHETLFISSKCFSERRAGCCCTYKLFSGWRWWQWGGWRWYGMKYTVERGTQLTTILRCMPKHYHAINILWRNHSVYRTSHFTFNRLLKLSES